MVRSVDLMSDSISDLAGISRLDPTDHDSPDPDNRSDPFEISTRSSAGVAICTQAGFLPCEMKLQILQPPHHRCQCKGESASVSEKAHPHMHTLRRCAQPLCSCQGPSL